MTTEAPGAAGKTTTEDTPLLEVRDLHVTYRQGGNDVPAVRGVDFTLAPGDTLGIAGESGCGKSTMALSLLRLQDRGARVEGEVLFRGENLLTTAWSRLRAVRWAGASVVFQGAMSALNPVRTVLDQIVEPIVLHDKVRVSEAERRATELLDSVGIPARRVRGYPHEFSGGQRQRVMIAMALACRPDLIIADEPTTALDVMVQAQILELLAESVRESRIAVMMITHDLSLLAHTCDRLAVMYAGRIVELGPSRQVLQAPEHPYTRALSRAFPTIGDPASRRAPAGLAGDPPRPSRTSVGCDFADRCPDVLPVCRTGEMQLWPAGPGRSAACVRALPDQGGTP
ncbi:peptide/nickel transport system ATP-binding protein [Actinacidiphila yanglinensis]|uniref:Peptide/nickel transport system ATP-binding protein n=1 Tax=Actinacidiphila yanglinensis TaxID=310779 RepID=A0A1H6DR54_9ACTN|nr:ABC transporter ATP-binding protein [Actinacidiphila yanglinensis]SEG87739.1 peptide/nickel transport system ATP-binding protein [Actinacidiphila yanglinensis]